MREESFGDPTKRVVGDDPNHRVVMAWADKDHEYTYIHRNMGMTRNEHTFWLGDKTTGKVVARMFLNKDGEVDGIETHPKYRRQGLATKLYNFVKETHERIPSIPAPKHSTSRTNLGQQWAKSTGEELPPLQKRVAASDYKGAHWE